MITAGAENLFDASGNVTFDNPNTVRTFSYYNELLKLSPPDAASYSWDEPLTAVLSGKAALTIHFVHPAQMTQLNLTPDQIGVAAIPQPKDNGQPGTIYFANSAMILTSDPAKQAAAAEFIRFLLEPDQCGLMVNAEPGSFLPTNEDCMNAPAFVNQPNVKKWNDAVQAELASGKYGALFGTTPGGT